MSKITMIDYEAGNTMSVMKALQYLGMEVELTNDRKLLLCSDKIVFPGVGAYFDAMQKLRKYDLVDTIKEVTGRGTPFLGICLGMQLLFEGSSETIGSDIKDGEIEGLGLLKGHIRRFSDTPGYKIPHMGWNSIKIKDTEKGLFKNLPQDSYVYFVHSYYLDAADKSDVAATCEYISTFDAAVQSGNIYGCQFHPEKSGDTGLEILKNFCEL